MVGHADSVLACYAHVQDDSDPQRPRRPAPHAEGAGGDGGYVALRLSVARAAAGGGAANAGRVPGTVATERASEAACVAGRHHSRDARRTVIVLDASVVVELLLGTQAADSLAARILGETPWHAPAVLDLEVANAIRRLCTIHETSHERGSRAIGDLGTLPVRRYPHTPLLDRIWQLRPNLTAYDAAYIALAEALRAPLVTRDRRLARASGHRARIDLV